MPTRNLCQRLRNQMTPVSFVSYVCSRVFFDFARLLVYDSVLIIYVLINDGSSDKERYYFESQSGCDDFLIIEQEDYLIV